MIGFCVPHFWSVHCRVEMKYTSPLNGDSKPYFQPRMVERIGMLLVSSVYMPGILTSASCPSLTNAGRLPLADDELGAVLDLVLVAREAVRQDLVLARLGPLDDVDELAADPTPSPMIGPPSAEPTARRA